MLYPTRVWKISSLCSEQRWLECALPGVSWVQVRCWCTSNGHGTQNSFGSRGRGGFRLQKLLASSSRGFWLTRGSWTLCWWLLQWCSGAGAKLCLGGRDLQRLQQGEISMTNHNRASLFNAKYKHPTNDQWIVYFWKWEWLNSPLQICIPSNWRISWSRIFV